MFTDTVTIYAHRITNGSDVWERFMYNCQISETNITTSDGERQSNTNEITVTIPGTDIVAFDLKGLDMIVIGACNETISSTYTIKDLIAEYNAKTIYSQTNSTRRSLLKHWTVVAK